MSAIRSLTFLLALLLIIPLISSFFVTTNLTKRYNQTNVWQTSNSDLQEEGRKKKHKDKYLLALLVGAVLVKLILFPLAVKAMAVMSTVSVLLSTLSLIMSSIVGYAKLAYKREPDNVLKLVHINDVWSKGDEVTDEYLPQDSLEYYPNVPLEQVHYYD